MSGRFAVTRGKLVLSIVALLGLTALSWWLSHFQTGDWEVPIAMGIAATKVTIVALFFMDLAEVRGTLRVAAFAAPIFTLLLVLLALGDVLMR